MGNLQTLEEAVTYFGRLITKGSVLHPDTNVKNAKKKWAMEVLKRQWNLKCILLSKRSQCAKTLYCDYSYITFWERQNFGDNKKINGCQGLRWGGMNRWENRGFLGNENALYDALMIYTCHYSFL